MTSPGSTRRSPERRRRVTMAVGAGVVVLVACVIAAGIVRFGGDDGGARTTAATATSTLAPAAVATAPTTTAPTTTTAPPAAANATAIGRTYAVGTRTLTFVDGSRTTSPNGSFGGGAHPHPAHRGLVPGRWSERRRADRGRAAGRHPRAVSARALRPRLRRHPRLLRSAARALGGRGLRRGGAGVPDPQRIGRRRQPRRLREDVR